MQIFFTMLARYAGLGLCMACIDAGATIYVCTDPDGHRTYTDLGCKTNTVYEPPLIEPLVFAPLEDIEQRQLDALSERSAANAQARQRAAQRQRRAVAKAEGARRQECRQARAALDALTRKRRKGYPLSAQQQLDAQEDALKTARRQHCG